MSRLDLQSPAKLNLYLKVLNKRADGFHNIKTIFQRIDLRDKITLKSVPSPTIKIICNHPQVPVGSKNLAHRAVKLIQEECGIKKGVEIFIDKRIPVAAGLAGGSSNGATVLIGLNRLWHLGLTKKKMISMAKTLGSDVPFFLEDASWAVGTERGDVIQKLNINNKLWSVVVVPRIKMYSSSVYEALNLQLTKGNDDVSILIHNLRKKNILGFSAYMHNDLEGVILSLKPNLRLLKQKLKALQAKGVMVSGSGPSVFGITETEKNAKEIQAVLRKKYSQVYVVRTF